MFTVVQKGVDDCTCFTLSLTFHVVLAQRRSFKTFWEVRSVLHSLLYIQKCGNLIKFYKLSYVNSKV